MTNRLVAGLVLGLFCFGSAVAQERFTEGVHYKRLDAPQPTAAADRVEVIEFFSYGCGHCNEFEPSLVAWKQDLPENVNLRLIPAGLGRAIFQQLAAVFYIADELGVLDDTHAAMFTEIHEKKNRAIMSREGLSSFFGQFGVEEAAFDAAIASPEVQERFAAGEQAARAYGLQGVPMMVVNGKYSVMRNDAVGSYDQLLEVVDYLVEREAVSSAGG
ncbi:MAG: thiol:disulfide interchange protein DsbA/DsbL [Pseudomonadota bacterium]